MLPLPVSLSIPELFGGDNASFTLYGPVTTLVGPNGAGKSQVMRGLKQKLQSTIGNTLLLPAGRLLPMEEGRLVIHPNVPEPQGNASYTLREGYRPNWFKLETVQGVLNRLSERIDVQIKVVERLRTLFSRELILAWERGNLRVRFQRNGSEYSYAKEASGLLHLVALLSALYDDDLKAVLLDEPGISLHPQLQAFVLREIKRVAGDPAEGGKVIVLATHAAAMVRLRTLEDLPSFVFFRDSDTPPVQVEAGDGVLLNRRLATFVRGLGTGHREALFANRPLLVEGPSDEVVVDALDAAIGTNLHAAGSHILPLTGVTNMAPAVKLLRLTGKTPTVIADLDAVTDNLDLVITFNDVEAGREAALEAGHGSLHEVVKGARDELVQTVDAHWESIEHHAKSHPYWTDQNSSADETERKRRSTAAVLLTTDVETISGWKEGDRWVRVKTRMTAALNLLESAGCFVLRAGSIEDSYFSQGGRSDKVNAAYAEAEAIMENASSAKARHDVVVRALRMVSQSPAIDESAAVAKAFVAVVAPTLDELIRNPEAETVDLVAIATQHTRDSAALFGIERVTEGDQPAVRVDLNARVLDVEGFPVVVKSSDNINEVARSKIRPRTYPPNHTSENDSGGSEVVHAA